MAGRKSSAIENPTNRIRELRLKAGLTLDQLAERAGTTGATIGRYETGDIELTLPNLQKVAAALGVRAADLLNESAA